MTFIYYWTIPLHSFITKNNRGCEPNLTELQHVSAIFNTLKKKSRALKDWIGWWSNCWIFGAWFLQSGTTSAFWWLERLDSKSWVNNQIYSTGLCVLLNYTRTFVSGVFSVKSTKTIQNIPFSLITYIGYKRHINLRH